jgi:hypothetical protein
VVKPALTDIIQAYLYNRLTEHDPSECHDVLVVEGALGIDSVAERRVCEDLVVLAVYNREDILALCSASRKYGAHSAEHQNYLHRCRPVS